MHKKAAIEGIAAPLPIGNLDTDQIMPKQFLKIIGKEGLERGVLHDLRFAPDGTARPDFILNQPAYRTAKILIAGPNFGCGSSREHAVWGLQQLGIEAVIAPSFGEIFYGNALNNRLLLIALDEAEVAALAAEASVPGTNRVCIDIRQAHIQSGSGKVYPFSLTPRHREMIVEGLDMIGATMRMLDAVEDFESKHYSCYPWMLVAGTCDVTEPARPRGAVALHRCM